MLMMRKPAAVWHNWYSTVSRITFNKIIRTRKILVPTNSEWIWVSSLVKVNELPGKLLIHQAELRHLKTTQLFIPLQSRLTKGGLLKIVDSNTSMVQEFLSSREEKNNNLKQSAKVRDLLVIWRLRASLEVQPSVPDPTKNWVLKNYMDSLWILLLPFGLSNSSSHMWKQQNPLKHGTKKRFVVSIGDNSSKTRSHFPAYVGLPTWYRYHPVSTLSCWRLRGSHLSLQGPTASAKQHILQNQGTTVVNPAMSLTRTVDASENTANFLGSTRNQLMAIGYLWIPFGMPTAPGVLSRVWRVISSPFNEGWVET